MTQTGRYIIRGGIEGRERLRVLARAMQPTTSALLDRVGVTPGMACLDVGCGGGDVTLELARRVIPGGSAVGADLDETKLSLAREKRPSWASRMWSTAVSTSSPTSPARTTTFSTSGSCSPI